MSAIIIGLMSLLLILVSGFLVLIILMQRASSNSGMGSALGGGAAESALGAGAGNMLTKSTIIGSVAFFVLSFGLYLYLLAGADERGPANTLPGEEMAPAAEETDAATTEESGEKQLMNLPEGMESTNLRQQLENQGATTTTVNSDQGSMIITEDAIKVDPATADDAEKVDAADAESAADEASSESTEDASTESASTEDSAPAEEESAPADSSESTESTETNAQ